MLKNCVTKVCRMGWPPLSHLIWLELMRSMVGAVIPLGSILLVNVRAHYYITMAREYLHISGPSSRKYIHIYIHTYVIQEV